VYEEMKRFAPVIALVIAAVVLGAVNATVFAYRWMQGKVTVAGPTEARGAACVGFYNSSGSERSYGGLPAAGTNYNAPTYGTNYITVTPGQKVCQWTVGTTIYYLYEGITVEIPITVGSWYIKDFYGFGYYGTAASDPTVYVYIKVEQSITDTNIKTAYLYIYKGDTSVATVDLKTEARVGPITLNPGDALQLDLFINATSATSATFKVGFYATQATTPEAPR
jgi:hypothetical protein